MTHTAPDPWSRQTSSAQGRVGSWLELLSGGDELVYLALRKFGRGMVTFWPPTLRPLASWPSRGRGWPGYQTPIADWPRGDPNG